MSRRRYCRVGMGLMPTELERARRAARARGMAPSEFFRQCVIVVSDETLSRTRHEIDPYERRDIPSFPLSRERR